MKRRKVEVPTLSSQDKTINDESTTSALLDPKGSESPDQFLQKLLSQEYGLKVQVKPATGLKDFFPTPTEEQMASYTTQIVAAARQNDVAELKRLSKEGSSMNCFNRFGECLLHMACRRGFKDMFEFLMEQPNIAIRVVDDCGRTPLHDLCWNPAPQLELCKRILEQEPSLFFVSDRRGYTPFEYVRPEHWPEWKKFLLENRSYFEKMKEPSLSEIFCR